MERTLSVLLTAALVGSMMIAGVAGTAAATEKHDHKADAIDSITFYNNDDGELKRFAKATWNGDQFVVRQLDKNDEISLTTKSYNGNGPTKVKWTYEGYVGAEYPDFVRVNADGKTCDYTVDSTRYPFTGTVAACEPTGDHDEHDKHDDYDGNDKHEDKHDDYDGNDKHEDKHDDYDGNDKHEDKHDDYDENDKHEDKHDDYDGNDKHKDSKTERSFTIVNVVVTLFS